MTKQEKDLRRSAKVVTQESARRFVKRATYCRLNRRRGHLIDLKVAGKLTADQFIEYTILQSEVGRLVELAYPRPQISEKLKAILKKYNIPEE